MNSLERFFLICSGVDKKILQQAPTEYNKYIGVGATVFFTGIFAGIASSYALYTVFQNAFTALFFGLAWGLMIFNLDRYIVSTLKKKGNFIDDFMLAVPRIILAIIISIVISKPIELKIFETEIKAETISMQQEKRKEHEDLLKLRFQKDLEQTDLELKKINDEVNTLKSNKDQLTLEALKEADGTGGSKIRNMGPIYKAKLESAAQADAALAAKSAEASPKIKEWETRKSMLISSRDEALQSLEEASLTGFASQIEALSRLTEKSQAISLTSIFLMLLFIAIETAPLFVKLISERSSYDYVLDKIETDASLDHKAYTYAKKLEVNTKIEFDANTKNHQVKQSIKAENEVFDHALQSEVEQIKRGHLSLVEYLKRTKFFSYH